MQGCERVRAWGREAGTRQEAGQGHRPRRLLPRLPHPAQQLLDRARGDLCQGQVPVPGSPSTSTWMCPLRPQERCQPSGYGAWECVRGLAPEGDKDQHWGAWWRRAVDKAVGSPAAAQALGCLLVCLGPCTSQRQSPPTPGRRPRADHLRGLGGEPQPAGEPVPSSPRPLLHPAVGYAGPGAAQASASSRLNEQGTQTRIIQLGDYLCASFWWPWGHWTRGH